MRRMMQEPMSESYTKNTNPKMKERETGNCGKGEFYCPRPNKRKVPREIAQKKTFNFSRFDIE